MAAISRQCDTLETAVQIDYLEAPALGFNFVSFRWDGAKLVKQKSSKGLVRPAGRKIYSQQRKSIAGIHPEIKNEPSSRLAVALFPLAAVFARTWLLPLLVRTETIRIRAASALEAFAAIAVIMLGAWPLMSNW